jgi:hypothetical protein
MLTMIQPQFWHIDRVVSTRLLKINQEDYAPLWQPPNDTLARESTIGIIYSEFLWKIMQNQFTCDPLGGLQYGNGKSIVRVKTDS